MTRFLYSRDELGKEVQAPWGYYQPQEEGSLEYDGRRLLYTLGSACVEVSCCGHGSWEYARVEGTVVESDSAASSSGSSPEGTLELDTVDGAEQRSAVAGILQQRHPGVRVEFR